MPGAGNQAIALNLIHWLENHSEITADTTTIIFNISEFDRIDMPCDYNHPNANKHFPLEDEFGFKWLTQNFVESQPPFNRLLQQNLGYDQIMFLNGMAIISLINYIENNRYNYRILMLKDFIHKKDLAPQFVQDFLQSKKDTIVNFDNHWGMHEFCKFNGLLSEDKFHPSQQANHLMAQHINEHLLTQRNIRHA